MAFGRGRLRLGIGRIIWILVRLPLSLVTLSLQGYHDVACAAEGVAWQSLVQLQRPALMVRALLEDRPLSAAVCPW